MTNYSHPYLTVCLLDGCNKACKHCYRTAIPSGHGFKLQQKEAIASLDDATSLATACLFAGGEPTIWQQDGMDFLSLLVKASKQNGSACFLSNGHVFEEKDYAYEFVRRYIDECGKHLRMILSVDLIHANYNAEEQRIPFLDNLITARAACAGKENMTLAILSHWTSDERLNIPLRVLQKYADQGVPYEIADFMMWGEAADISDLACYVGVGSKNKDSLGPYRTFLTQRMIAAEKIEDKKEFEELPNRELLKRLSVCGRAPNFFISWDTSYYYCIPQMGHDWFSISEIGKLSLDAIASFHADRPVIKKIQELSIFGVLDEYRQLIPEQLNEEISLMRESIRFAGCSVCLRLHREGVLEKINQRLLNES